MLANAEAPRGVQLQATIAAMVDQPSTCSAGEILASLPTPRVAPFLQAAEGDAEKALDLYTWNARMAGAALEQLAHLEVLLRHAIDTQLAADVDEESVGIPWFLLPPYFSEQRNEIEKVRARLRARQRETRDQIVAGLPFGFWAGWFGSKYEKLWRRALYRSFPNGSGTRKQVTRLVEQVRKFRNRVAHHDSLINIDVGFEMSAVFDLAALIDRRYSEWMRKIDRTDMIGKARPVTPSDTVVVPGGDVWPFYRKSRAYVCQAGRYFRKVKHIAFYYEGKIQCDVPAIKKRYDNVVWSGGEVARLEKSKIPYDRKLAKIIKEGSSGDLKHGVYQVFILSSEDDPAHVRLDAPLRNDLTGKGSAFVNKQRYTSVHQLRFAQDLGDLR